MAKKKLEPWFDPKKNQWTLLLYHLIPYDRWLKKDAKKEGLFPKEGYKGRVYLFETPEAAEGAAINWMNDHPEFRSMAVLQVFTPPPSEIHTDYEIGAYYLLDPVPPKYVRLFTRIHATE